ncbi:MAG: type II toxin-antitoxin system VapB family antitoxin [Pseudomonadota bacterium]
MKTTVEINDTLFQEARALAAREGTTFRDLVETGLRSVLSSRAREPAEFRLRDASFGGQGMAADFARSPGSMLDAAYEDHGA